MYQGQVDLAHQIHDYSPGIASNGLFWTVPMPSQNLVIDMAVPQASMALSNVPVVDAHDLKNALTGGPSVPATISWDIEWTGLTSRIVASDPSQGFVGVLLRDVATIRWSAQQAGFTFVANPGQSTFAELAYVNNNLGVMLPTTVP